MKRKALPQCPEIDPQDRQNNKGKSECSRKSMGVKTYIFDRWGLSSRRRRTDSYTSTWCGFDVQCDATLT